MSESYGDRKEAVQRLRVADSHWTEAVRTFQTYPERLRRLARAADEQRRAFLYAEVCGITYDTPRDTASGFSLGPELDPANRIGATKLWEAFDTAQERWATALAGPDIVAIAQGFGEMSTAATAIADSLESEDHKRRTA